MKILFVPNYFYLNMPLFEKAITRLSQRGITASVWKLRGNTDIPADEKFDSFYFKDRGIDFTEVSVIQTVCRGEDIFRKFRLFIATVRNRRTIRRLLEEAPPAAVVVGSDLGNLNVRILIDACYSCSIPVVIMYNCDLTEPAKKNLFSRLYSLDNRFIFNSAFLSILRASLFNGTTPGEYALHSKVCVMSEGVREKLLSRNIPADRISVADMHFLDEISGAQAEDIRKILRVPGGHKVVVFFTECIQGVYGNKYAEGLYRRMSELLKTFSADIFFIIKLHPLENNETALLLKTLFDAPNARVITDFDAESLIKAADLCIAHFSRALITASLMGGRFLSINLMRDENRTFISGGEADLLEINSYEDFALKINQAINDAGFKDKMDKAIRGIAKRFSSPDGPFKADILEEILNKK